MTHQLPDFFLFEHFICEAKLMNESLSHLGLFLQYFLYLIYIRQTFLHIQIYCNHATFVLVHIATFYSHYVT